MTSGAATNVAAMTAALQGAADGSYAIAMPSNRRSMTSGRGSGHSVVESTSVGGGLGVGDYPSLGNGPSHGRTSNPADNSRFSGRDSSAIADDLPSSGLENNVTSSKERSRRASEGAYLTKGESKRTSGAELRCEQCGKGYKHSSCLTKHLSVPTVSHLPQTLPRCIRILFLCGRLPCPTAPGVKHPAQVTWKVYNLTILQMGAHP